MNLFGRNTSKKPELENVPGVARRAFWCSISAFDDIMYSTPKDYSPGGHIECLIMTSLATLQHFSRKAPNVYGHFQNEYIEYFKLYLKQNKLESLIPGDFEDFLDSRFQLISLEIKSMLEAQETGKTYLPKKLAYNFYDSPLQINGGMSVQLDKVLLTAVDTVEILNILDQKLSAII